MKKYKIALDDILVILWNLRPILALPKILQSPSCDTDLINTKLSELLANDPDASTFHARQHLDQRTLHGLVHSDHMLCGEAGLDPGVDL